MLPSNMCLGSWGGGGCSSGIACGTSEWWAGFDSMRCLLDKLSMSLFLSV